MVFGLLYLACSPLKTQFLDVLRHFFDWTNISCCLEWALAGTDAQLLKRGAYGKVDLEFPGSITLFKEHTKTASL